MLQSFEDYRDRMLAIIAAAEPRLTAAPPADTDALDLARVRMARIVTAYHLFAERELFGPCAAKVDPARRLRVRAIAEDCGALARDFRAFTRACAADPVKPRWEAYRPAALALMARIRQHLREAETEVQGCILSGAVPVAAPRAPEIPPVARRSAH